MADIGQLVGKRYTLLAEIGHGGMSVVYLALDSTLNKQWAVKEIRHIADESQRRRIIDGLVGEANLIKRFDHPAIPRIVDLIEENGSFFIVMDYVEGVTLAHRMDKTGKQPEEQVVSWGVQLCDVLDYLHRLDPPIVYRDLKPSNVMATPEGAVRIIDFGIACEMPPAEGALPDGYEARMGTPGYAAPEQYDEFGRCDARTDVYGLGALLYALLVGRRNEGEPYELPPLRQVLPQASAGLERVLAKALQKNPDDRYRNCAAFAYDLEHASDRDARLRRSMRGKWRVFCAFCTAAVVFLVAGAGALGAGSLAASSSYDNQMDLARQASEGATAEGHYVKAADTRPGATEPYEGLVKRYMADGKFTDTESEQLQQAVSDHSGSLRKHSESWGRLAFDIGKLYWYYYLPQDLKTDGGEGSPLQHARMEAAESWMDEASQSNFPDRELARLYATMCNFETSIVPLINEGSDRGKYAPYFHELSQLMDSMQSSDNDVMRLSTSNLVLDAIRTYPRKFRADGIDRQSLVTAVQSAQKLADKTDSTTNQLEQSRSQALGAVAPAEQAVAEAFTDINSKENK